MPQLIACRRPTSPALLIIAWGAQAIITQSLLLREAIVLMSGSELAWGVVLFAWLAGVAIGAIAGGHLAHRWQRVDLVLATVLIALGAAACVDLWIFRGARGFLALQPGELLPLGQTAMAALLLVSPVSSLVGMAFPLACRCIDKENGTTGPLGNVYAIESAGSLIGGAVFSFWAVEHASPVHIALACMTVTSLAATAYLAGCPGRRIAVGVTAIIGCSAAGIAACGGNRINQQLIHLRWQQIAPGYELAAEAETRYQNLALGRREDQFTLYADGQASITFPDPYTQAPLAHFWMCQHPSPRNVLLLGGGAEGLPAEILLHPIQHLDYVELDPKLTDLTRPFLSEADRLALRDSRVTVHHADVRHFVKTHHAQYDLVMARLPEPVSALNARCYTAEFYRELRSAMSPSAVLCLSAAAGPAALSRESAEYLALIRATLRQAFESIMIGWGDPAMILAATEPHLATMDVQVLTKRYAERRAHSSHFDPLWFAGATDWLEPPKLRQRSEELDAAHPTAISTDARPAVYMARLALLEKQQGRRATRTLERLRSLGIGTLLTASAAILVIVYLAYRWSKGRATGRTDGAIAISIGTTGLASMALSLVWLFAFQNLYGYVYQQIGWIIAVFMGGLVLGSTMMNRRKTEAGAFRRTWHTLIVVDLLLAILAAAAPGALWRLGAMQSSPAALRLVEWSILSLVLLTGILGGAAFSLAGILQMRSRREAGRTAGAIVGADHVGACLGALLTGLWLIPVFGTATTAVYLAGLKTAAALLLWAARPPRDKNETRVRAA